MAILQVCEHREKGRVGNESVKLCFTKKVCENQVFYKGATLCEPLRKPEKREPNDHKPKQRNAV